MKIIILLLVIFNFGNNGFAVTIENRSSSTLQTHVLNLKKEVQFCML